MFIFLNSRWMIEAWKNKSGSMRIRLTRDNWRGRSRFFLIILLCGHSAGRKIFLKLQNFSRVSDKVIPLQISCKIFDALIFFFIYCLLKGRRKLNSEIVISIGKFGIKNVYGDLTLIIINEQSEHIVQSIFWIISLEYLFEY